MATNSLVLGVVKGSACPGGDLEYTCTVSTTTTTAFVMRWSHLGSPTNTDVFYLYDEPGTLTNKSIAGFNTTVSIIPPDYTLTSTATLRGAMLSNNNITLQCRLQVLDPPLPSMIVTEGAFDLFHAMAIAISAIKS